MFSLSSIFDGLLGRFHILVTVGKATINMGARISLTPEIGFILLSTDDLLVVRSLVKDKS